MLNTHAPQKLKILKGNHKTYYNKNLRKVKANRSKDSVDIANYKKQHNLNVSLNCQAKSEYFNEVSNSESCLELGFFRKKEHM